MVDLIAGWPGDRDRLEDMANVAAGVWRPLAVASARFGQTEDQGTNARMLDECTGWRSTVIPASCGFVLAEAMRGNFRRLAETDRASLNENKRKAWVK